MDAIDLQNSVHIFGTIAVTCVIIAVTLYLLAPGYEVAVQYSVPVPDQCLPGWEGEVLDEPGLKVPPNGIKSSYGAVFLTCLNCRSQAHLPYNAIIQRTDRTWVLRIQSRKMESIERCRKLLRHRLNGQTQAGVRGGSG